MAALRDKIPYETVADAESPAHALADRDRETARTDGAATVEHAPDATDEEAAAVAAGEGAAEAAVPEADATSAAETETATTTAADSEPTTLAEHVAAVIERGSDTVRLLDADGKILDEGPASDVVSLVDGCEQRPSTVVLDGECTQKVVDVAAQRGVDVVVAARDGEYVKQPISVQVRIAD
jgi:hypothetical protein